MFFANQNTNLRGGVPLRTKITIPYLVLSLILAVAAAYIITQLVVENVEERFTKQLFEAGKISSELVVNHEMQFLESLRLLSSLEGVSEAILENDPNKLRTLTLGVVANDQREAVEFLDKNGNHILSIRHRKDGNPEEYDFSTGRQSLFSELNFVQNVLNQTSDLRGDKFAELVRTDGGDYLYISGPIYDSQGNLAGVVLVGESLENLATDMRAKTFAQITFYNSSGDVLASTLPDPRGLSSEAALETVSIKDSGSIRRDFVSSNISFAEILGVFEIRNDHEIGVLGVALSRNPLVEVSMTSRWQIFLLVAAAIFLIILVGINLANRITKPLLQLVNASVRVAEGDLNVTVAPESNDEVAVLAESFNSMVASLSLSQRELLKSYDDTLEGWAKALELRDKETEGHSDRVTQLTVRLAVAMGIQGQALVNIRRGALLHDIGKMGTPDAILRKEGPLSEDERRIIERHPRDAYDMLKKIDYLRPALAIPVCHHEKWDGSGYPQRLKGEQIPISARIFAIVDVWDALISDRPYRKALPRKEVVAYLKSQSGVHFDPKIVEAFTQLLKANNMVDI